jgi:hypothetical protein
MESKTNRKRKTRIMRRENVVEASTLRETQSKACCMNCADHG